VAVQKETGDIKKAKDIHRVVSSFFKKVKKDKLLSPYFADKTKADWEVFLPLMNSFWENALFYSGGYHGNPMQRHTEMNAIRAFSPEHYTRWTDLLIESIDEKYAGEKAELMKERARNISTIMQVKIAEK
jgi:hemoglobin